MNKLITAALLVLLTGCLRSEENTATVTSAPPKVQTPPEPEPAPDEPDAEPEVEIEEATEQNVGVKGRDYGGEIITEQISQYFRIQDRLVMQQIDKGLSEFKAFNNRMPESHEEFVEKVLKPRNLKLPEVKRGDRLYYDPEREKLVIAKPKLR